MPIYEYRCDNGHTFEAFQSMSDDALETCEVCDAAAHRVLSAPAIHYKGSGFYTTDYARKGKKGAPSPGSGESGPGGDSGGKDGSGSSGKDSSGSGSKEKSTSSSSSSSSSSSAKSSSD